MLALWVLTLFALLVLATLTVDWSRARMLDNQLATAVDSAALAGASRLKQGIQPAIDAAIEAASKNRVDGQPVIITPADVQLGNWDPATQSFTPLSGSDRRSAVAVRVAARRRGVAMLFGRFVGRPTVDLAQEAVATRGIVRNHEVDGRASPWLAGMPAGSRVRRYDGNPRDSVTPDSWPYRFDGRVTPGQVLYFRGISGSTGYAGSSNVSAEGQLDWIVAQRPDNGINTTYAPINALGGIFLDDRRPDSWALQPTLDFSTRARRNFTELRPRLKQVFYIGDGVNEDGALQAFVVPAGATRLYLGTIDEKGWWWDQWNGDGGPGLRFHTIEGTVQLVR
jgi:hypothetical protein